MILYSKNLLMEQKDKIDVDKILPVEWGTLKSFGVSINAADDKGQDIPTKSFCFVTDKGAFAINCSYDTIIPTKAQILSGYFVEGVFTEEFNGAFYTTSVNKGDLPIKTWCPAIYEILSDRIVWYYFDKIVRNIRNTTLSFWGWTNEMLNVGNNYTYKIIEGIMYIYYKENLVLKIY